MCVYPAETEPEEATEGEGNRYFGENTAEVFAGIIIVRHRLYVGMPIAEKGDYMERHLAKDTKEYDYEELSNKLLSDLDIEMAGQIRLQAMIYCYEDGDTIQDRAFFDGRRLWRLLKGELHFVMRNAEGRSIVFLKMTKQNCEYLFPQGCLETIRINVEIVCTGVTELWCLPEKLSSELYEQYHFFKERKERYCQNMYGKLVDFIYDLTFLSLGDRLHKILLEYSDIYRTDQIMITHEQLAAELATSREVISRLLKKMEEEQLIVIKRKSIQILI